MQISRIRPSDKMHRAEVVRIDGTSYRAKEAEKRDAQRLAERAAKAATPRSQGWTMSIAPTPDPSRSQNTPAAAPTVPQHWTPEQALAAFECLQAMRQALCATYGTQVQQAWREQLVPDGPPPDFDPDKPFVTGAHHQPLRHRHRQNPQGPARGPACLCNSRRPTPPVRNRYLASE